MQRGQKLSKFFPCPKFQPNVFQLSKLSKFDVCKKTVSGRNNFFMAFPHILDQIEMFYFTILSESNVTNTFSQDYLR